MKQPRIDRLASVKWHVCFWPIADISVSARRTRAPEAGTAAQTAPGANNPIQAVRPISYLCKNASYMPMNSEQVRAFMQGLTPEQIEEGNRRSHEAYERDVARFKKAYALRRCHLCGEPFDQMR